MLSHGTLQPCRLPAAGLPLTPFEEYMLLDDRPSHPMVIAARFDFSDGPPPPHLADAFDATLRQEPLLAARVTKHRRGGHRWQPGPPPALAFSADQSGADEPPGSFFPRIDPFRGPMIHARVITRSAGWSIMVAVHHAACDGLGLVGFMDRWLLHAGGKQGRRPRPAADILAALRERGRVAGSWREFVRMLPRLAKGLEGVKQFVSHEVAALGVPPGAERWEGSAPDDSTAWQPAIISATLDEDLVERLDEAARTAGVMVNDLLMTAFVTTLGTQLDGHGTEPVCRDWIRLATPMSLRTKADHALPAANRVSMVFLDRRAADRLDQPALLRSFKDEMDVIRGHNLGHIFPLSLAASRWLPGGLRRTTRLPKPQSTAVLSNLGRCFHRSPLADDAGRLRLGESRLAGWWIVPPIRPGTALAAATHETHGQRTIAFHVDAARVSVARAQCWLDGMHEALRSYAGEPRRVSSLESTA